MQKPIHSNASPQGGALLHGLLTVSAVLFAIILGGGGAVLIYGGIQQKSGSPVLQADPPFAAALAKAAEAAPAGTSNREALVAEGQKIYAATCVACHQPTGQGLPNVFPPLAGSDWICNENADCAVAVVLGGLQGPIKVNGQPFSTAIVMPPHALTMDDAKIAAVLTYVRNSWGNEGSSVSASRVAELRERFKEHSTPWTMPEVHAAIHGAATHH